MTTEDAAAILSKANLWITELHGRGQVDDATAAHLQETMVESFTERLDSEGDPLLVVMLCGPTAVGKSSLINALAGAHIACPGLGATTSAAMLYVHEQDDPSRLFEYSHPLGHNGQSETELVRHRREELLHKVLVDTPDIDSVRLEHKELTARLVHAADIVLFVTSPEKYKVMRSARWVLQQRQQRAIAFVLNKWDRQTLGLQHDRRPELEQDFRHVLADEGYPDALVFKVSALAGQSDNPGQIEIENELPALRSWLETGITQATATMIRQRRLRLAWGRLAAAIQNVAPVPLSNHPLCSELASRLGASGGTLQQRVNAEAAVFEPVGLEDNGRPTTPGLLGMWTKTWQRVASATAPLRTGLSLLNLVVRSGLPVDGPTYQHLPGVVFGTVGAAVLSETTNQLVRQAAVVRFALGPVGTAWSSDIAQLQRELARLPLDVATELAAAANRMTFRRSAGIVSIYLIEGTIILVLLIAVGRIGLDFIVGLYEPGSLFLTVLELISILVILGNITANMFFPPLRRQMRRTLSQQASSLARMTLASLQTTLRDHVEAVDRLAGEANELLRMINRVVIALTMSNGSDADVDRLFGQPQSLPSEAEPTTQPNRSEAEGGQLTARRPRFD